MADGGPAARERPATQDHMQRAMAEILLAQEALVAGPLPSLAAAAMDALQTPHARSWAKTNKGSSDLTG